MENKKINTKNVPIGIPMIQKSVPKSTVTPKRMIWPFYFLTFLFLPEKIVFFSRMILRLKKPVLIPTNEVNNTLPKNVSM